MPNNTIRDAIVNLGPRETNIELTTRLTKGILEGKNYVLKGTKDPVDYKLYLNNFISTNEKIALLGKEIENGATIPDSIAQRYVVLTERSNQIAPQVREVAIRMGLIPETVEETAPEQPVAQTSRLRIALASTTAAGLVGGGYFFRDAISYAGNYLGSYLPESIVPEYFSNLANYAGSYLPDFSYAGAYLPDLSGWSYAGSYLGDAVSNLSAVEIGGGVAGLVVGAALLKYRKQVAQAVATPIIAAKNYFSRSTETTAA